MSAKSLVWSSRDGQGYFGFEMIVAEANVIETRVATLRRFNKGIDLEFPGSYAWGDYDCVTVEGRSEALRVEAAKCGGHLHEITYEAWLRWYTPLCSRGVVVNN